MVITAKNLLA